MMRIVPKELLKMRSFWYQNCSKEQECLRDKNNNLVDILVGHTTWDSYSEMHRIFKIYDFSYTLYGNKEKSSFVEER